MGVPMLKISPTSFIRSCTYRTTYNHTQPWTTCSLRTSSGERAMGSKIWRPFVVRVILFLGVLSLSLVACGPSTAGPSAATSSTHQTASPSSVADAIRTSAPTHTNTPTATLIPTSIPTATAISVHTPASTAIPTPTATPTPTPTPTSTPTPKLTPSSPTAFLVHEDQGQLDIDPSIPVQTIHIDNTSDTSQPNCCTPMKWKVSTNPSPGDWLKLDHYSGELNAGVTGWPIQVSTKNLCGGPYNGRVAFTEPLKPDGSQHYVDITYTPPPCITPTPTSTPTPMPTPPPTPANTPNSAKQADSVMASIQV
jgi:hypothetical protein